ncbi:MAG: hypothetical protein R2834_04770 [Rhodothermales bacterium]
MEKKSVVRLQLLALAGITVLLLVRVVSGPPSPDGLVVMDRLEPNEIQERAFVLETPTKLHIHAVGAFDHRAGDTPQLAAQAWILDHTTREPVWHMDPDRNTTLGRGLLAESEDSLMLPTGAYEVYFAAYGGLLSGASVSSTPSTLFGRLINARQRWQDDARRWQVVVTGVGPKENTANEVDLDDLPPRTRDDVIWSATSVGNGEFRSHTFRIEEPATVRIHATGEITSEPNDAGSIENLGTGEMIWTMALDRTRPAGGAPENREAVETLALQPGVYRASFRTDRTHAYDAWLANPPYDPTSWGMTLSAARPADKLAFRAIDPWQDGIPLASIDRVGNDVFRSVLFTVEEPSVFFVYGMGEMTPEGRYDFGWIERVSPTEVVTRREERDDAPDPSTAVWEMDYAASANAGGSDDNREQFDVIRLDPGLYAMVYRSDYAHAYGDWRRERPAHAERWGISLFGLRSGPPASFTMRGLIDYAEEAGPVTSVSPLPPPPAIAPVPPVPAIAAMPAMPGSIIVTMAPLGSNEKRAETFELSEKTVLHIRAMGEISLSGGLYDYGRIVTERGGDVVWTMNRDNTVPAGGGNANRLFDGDIILEAGRYIAQFETDGTHAFGDFDKDPPASPEAWGMVISRLNETP